MPDNVGRASAKAPSTRIVRTSRREQMEAYDALPERWRRLVGALPVPQDCREVLAVWQLYGEQGYQMALEMLMVTYPDWQPPADIKETQP